MTSTSLTYPMRGRSPFRGLVVLGSMAVLGVVVIGVAGASWDLFAFLLASAIFLACLCVTRALPGVAVARGKKAFLSATLVIWVFLMLSEIVFTHFQTAGSAASGHFDPSAYYQAASWILSFCALVVVSCLRPAYLRRLFTGPLKWASIFAVVAVLSCPLSTIPVYSAALAFKLCVIVLALCGIGEAVEDETGVFKLFSALFIGTLIVVVMEFAIPFLGPGPAFHGDRLGAMIGLSGTCGMLLLLSVLFLWLKKNPWFLVCGVFSVVIMMLAGTKGGIVASFVSLMMFFFLLKKPAQALAVSLAFSIIFALCVAFTPLGQSLQKYSESGNATTLTGRTNLWTAVWPEIEKRPLLGHGYRASRFVSEEVEGAFAEAGNMHNSFLEVLYNNGLAGLVPILVMSVLTVVNLWGVLLRPATLQIRYYAAAAFAFYTHLFVWGLISVTFGGAPDNRFMAFFAVLLISVLLKDQSNNKYGKPVYAEYNV